MCFPARAGRAWIREPTTLRCRRRPLPAGSVSTGGKPPSFWSNTTESRASPGRPVGVEIFAGAQLLSEPLLRWRQLPDPPLGGEFRPHASRQTQGHLLEVGAPSHQLPQGSPAAPLLVLTSGGLVEELGIGIQENRAVLQRGPFSTHLGRSDDLSSGERCLI